MFRVRLESHTRPPKNASWRFFVSQTPHNSDAAAACFARCRQARSRAAYRLRTCLTPMTAMRRRQRQLAIRRSPAAAATSSFDEITNYDPARDISRNTHGDDASRLRKRQAAGLASPPTIVRTRGAVKFRAPNIVVNARQSGSSHGIIIKSSSPSPNQLHGDHDIRSALRSSGARARGCARFVRHHHPRWALGVARFFGDGLRRGHTNIGLGWGVTFHLLVHH